MVKNNSSVHQQMYVYKTLHTHKMEHYLVLKRKEGNSWFYCNMMNHENIMLSERNPISKHKCCMILYIWVT